MECVHSAHRICNTALESQGPTFGRRRAAQGHPPCCWNGVSGGLQLKQILRPYPLVGTDQGGAKSYGVDNV